jgi:hypothetical protein
MRLHDDSPPLNADQQIREVAGILAAGILRLRARAALPGQLSGGNNLPESSDNCLDVPVETVLSVHSG